MTKFQTISRGMVGSALAAVLAVGLTATAPGTAQAQNTATRPTNDVTVSVGAGRMVRLDSPMSDLFVANDAVADVQVRSASQIYIFGKAAGQTTVYATNAAGRVVYSANVRVGNNIDSVDDLLNTAMPNAEIQATPMNGMILLTGTVANPSDVEEARTLVQAFVGEGTQVLSRIKTATPLQVNLHVKIVEVNRSLVKSIGVNLLSRDTTGGFLFGIMQGRGVGSIGAPDITGLPLVDASARYGLPAGSLSLPFNPATGDFVIGGTAYNPVNPADSGTTINAAGRLLGLDILSAIDLAETNGQVTTLAEPNLTSLSGETASFLAGGEFPVPSASGINGTSIEFKQYGVSLSFTPTVLEGGRISMRVRPEVSELSPEGAIRISGFDIPSLTTRRVETTVELGSGQSFMIGGLLRNGNTNSIDKAPWLGDLPILGALFRSSTFRRNESELVVVVTPYLVKPVNASQIALPTDGLRTANDPQRILLDKQDASRSGEQRPGPTMAPPQTVAPGIGQVGSASPAAPASAQASAGSTSAAPGFSF